MLIQLQIVRLQRLLLKYFLKKYKISSRGLYVISLLWYQNVNKTIYFLRLMDERNLTVRNKLFV
jgi:hypothetical protein